MLRDFFGYLLAVITTWSALITGGVIMAGVWLWTTYTQREFPRQLSLVIAAAFVFLATFLVWHDQRRRLDERDNSNTELRSQLAALREPDLKLDILSIGIGQVSSPSSDRTAATLTLIARIRNFGADSIADDWALAVTTPDGNVVHQAQPIAMPDATLTIKGIDGGQVTYTHEDALYHGAVDKPIARGAQVSGVLTFLFPKIEREKLTNALTQNTWRLRLTCKDVRGRVFEATDNTSVISGVPAAHPGIRERRAKP